MDISLIDFLPLIAALILSIIIHEVAHGYMANWLGDPTARLAGRLTLNPIPHIDPVGSILLPALLFFTHAGILFGWAKPVPYNPYNLRNQRWGELLVAAAGPGVNLILAIVFAVVVRLASSAAFVATAPPAFIDIASYIVYINLLLAFFNLLPIPPLDGSKILLGLLPVHLERNFRTFIAQMESYGLVATFIFIFLFVYVLSGPFHLFVGTVFALLTGQHI